MTTQTAPKNLAPHRRRFPAGEYRRLEDIGVLKPEERAELTRG